MNRRMFASAAVLAPVALVGCAQIEKMTGTTTVDAAVEAVFAKVQFLLPLVDALALGISVAYPGAGPLVAVVTPYLNSAATVFQSMAVTMASSAAMPLVQKIEADVSGAVNAVADAVSAPNAPASLAAFQSRVAQAQAAVAALTTFANGVAGTVSAPTPVAMPYLHA